jgi:hypothetical protein
MDVAVQLVRKKRRNCSLLRIAVKSKKRLALAHVVCYTRVHEHFIAARAPQFTP